MQQFFKTRQVYLEDWVTSMCLVFRGVAQFGSASALGAEGLRFKSELPDQLEEGPKEHMIL